MLRILFWLCLLSVLFGLGLIFSVPNLTTVNLYYYFGTLESPLAILLVFALGVGALLGVLFSSLWVLRVRYENRRLRKMQRETERELAHLRIKRPTDYHADRG